MTLDVGWIGIWLLVASLLLIVVECAVAAVWSVRIVRRGSALNALLTTQRAELKSDLERLQSALAETQLLWQPYRRLLRWLGHPLTIALMQSLIRRAAAR